MGEFQSVECGGPLFRVGGAVDRGKPQFLDLPIQWFHPFVGDMLWIMLNLFPIFSLVLKMPLIQIGVLCLR